MKKETKENFTCAYRTEHLLLKDDYKTAKDEISSSELYSFFDSVNLPLSIFIQWIL